MLHDLFLRHPDDVGETYAQHFAAAFTFGFRLILAGAACLIHAVVPALFERTASAAVVDLHAKFVARWRGHATSARPEIDYAI